ncbi:MAG: LPS assembly lipoprotein LptE [Caulobacterales bacterium]
MRVVTALLSLLVLAACGFQPMYGGQGGQDPIGPVQISEIDGRAGHVLRTELSRLLSIEDAAGQPQQLDIQLTEQIIPLGLRRDETASRGELRLTANYSFLRAGDTVPLRGSLVSVVNYDVPLQAFGGIAAQDDARERAAETLAQRVRAELALRVAQARRPS